MIFDFVKLSLRNVRKRLLRSSLTVLGIFIAVSTIFVLISLSLGLESAIEEQFRLLGTDKIFIQPRGQLAGPGTGGAVQLTLNDVETIKKVRGVKDYTYWVASTGEIEFAGGKRFFTIGGFPVGQSDIFLESGAYKIDEGKFLEEGERGSVTIGSHYKYNFLFKKPLHAKDTLTINGEAFIVKAVFKPLGNPGDDRMILMSVEDFRRITGIENRIDSIIVQIEPGENVAEVAERIRRELYKSRDVDKDTQDFSLLTPDQLLESFGTILSIITSFLLGLAAISLVVGGIGIANTMFTSVLERRRDIGVMKSIGARNRDVLTLFIIESGLLGLVGGVLGVALGVGIGGAIEYIATAVLETTLLRVSTPFWLAAGCLIFAFLAGALSGALPARQASRIRPTEALRYE